MRYSDGELEGIGGWLAFFLVTLGVITPATSLFSVLVTLADPNLAAAYGPVWPKLLMAEWGLTIVTCLLCWFAVARFFLARNWRTVQIAIGTLVFLVLASIVIEPMLVSMLSGLPFDQLFAGVGAGLVRPIGYATIWTAYLLKSSRVANTYRRYPDDDALGEVFE